MAATWRDERRQQHGQRLDPEQPELPQPGCGRRRLVRHKHCAQRRLQFGGLVQRRWRGQELVVARRLVRRGRGRRLCRCRRGLGGGRGRGVWS